MLCVIYKQAHVHTRGHIQPNSSLYVIYSQPGLSIWNQLQILILFSM